MLVDGFVAAPFAPMNRDGSIHTALIERYAAHLAANGVVGVFVNGTTGEGYSLSLKERKAIAEAWMAAGSPPFRVMVHVGAESGSDARELAAHARSIGAAAVGAMGPVFFKSDVDGLVGWCREVAAAAPDLPFYYYHIPAMNGTTGPFIDLLHRCIAEIPTFRGVKYTHDDLVEYRHCLELSGGRLDLFFGRDEILLPALSLGARSMVGSTYNYAMALHGELAARFASGDLTGAQDAQAKVMRLVRLLDRHGGGLVCGKALMRGVGLDLGPCRLPNRTLSEEETADVVAAATQIGVFAHKSGADA